MDYYIRVGVTFEDCLEYLGEVTQRCVETKLVLNWEKYYFMVKEGFVLEHNIPGQGIQVDQSKVKMFAMFPHPISI